MASAPQVTQSQITQTNLPAYVEPYVTEMLDRARDTSYQPYIPYDQERIAGFTPGQVFAQQQAYDLQRPEQFGAATQMAGAAGLGSLAAGQYNPYTFTTQNVAAPNVTQYQMDPAQMFDQAQANTYMSPYMQSVVDATKREAITDAQKTQLMTNLGAARQGTYGGARQLLAGTERERALGQNLSDIQSKGLQAAFENAQQQFERDRAARMGVNRTNLEALLSTQQLGAQTGLQAALANQQSDLEAKRLTEASRQFGTTSGLQALAQALQSAQTLGTLGTTQQQADLARIQAQAAAGSEQQAQEQKYLDTRYADFLRQRDYPMEQLSYYNSLLRGLPMTMGSTQTTYAPPPSLLSQVGGLGLGALSLSKLYN